MDECICLKGVTFDRKYFHSAVLVRGSDPTQTEYFGNLILSLNFLVPFIGGNQGILKTMSLKGSTPIETIDLYLTLLEVLKYIAGDNDAVVGAVVNRDDLIKELLTADEKALSKGAPIPPVDPLKGVAPPSAFEATEEDAK